VPHCQHQGVQLALLVFGQFWTQNLKLEKNNLGLNNRPWKKIYFWITIWNSGH
jgi:hypothetical protein